MVMVCQRCRRVKKSSLKKRKTTKKGKRKCKYGRRKDGKCRKHRKK